MKEELDRAKMQGKDRREVFIKQILPFLSPEQEALHMTLLQCFKGSHPRLAGRPRGSGGTAARRGRDEAHEQADDQRAGVADHGEAPDHLAGREDLPGPAQAGHARRRPLCATLCVPVAPDTCLLPKCCPSRQVLLCGNQSTTDAGSVCDQA